MTTSPFLSLNTKFHQGRACQVCALGLTTVPGTKKLNKYVLKYLLNAPKY